MSGRQTLQTVAIKKVVSIINNYGYKVPIYRDIYSKDELGCKVLEEERHYITDVVCIIDNSSSSRGISITNNQQGVIKDFSYATLYTPYVEDLPIQEGDIVLYENVFYKVQEITDIVHYNVLYSISLERVDVDG